MAEDSSGRPTSPLASQIQALTQDLEWTLAHFTFVADVTTLAQECDIAHSPAMSVASCHRFALPALAFVGDSAALLANYATFLADPGSEVYLMVNEEQRAVVNEAFTILEATPEWQMIFRGDPATLAPGPAAALEAKDLPAMRALAEAEALPAFEKDPLASGPAFGVWEGRTLVAMATTRLTIPGVAEIGNIVTRAKYRERGYGAAVTSALAQALAAKGLCVFLMVYQNNATAIRLYERLGFETVRPMYLLRCRLKAPESEDTVPLTPGEHSKGDVT